MILDTSCETFRGYFCGDFMKWFKHFSDASNDEFISDLEDEFGLVGYARWWKLIEAIAAQMEAGNSKCSASYSEKKWCRKLQCKPKVLARFLECTNNAGKTKVKQNGNIIEISCSKLLNLRDNHSRNLQVPDKKLAPDLHLEVDVEAEVEEENPLNLCERDFIISEHKRIFSRPITPNEFGRFGYMMQFPPDKVEKAFTAAKGKKSLNYVISVLENDKPEKKPKGRLRK